jgi:hypothetical protein
LKDSLASAKIPIDNTLQKIISKHEHGDNANYQQLSTHVFRQLNGNDTYNRVDKISLNDKPTMSSHKNSRVYGYANEIKKHVEDEHDDF